MIIQNKEKTIKIHFPAIPYPKQEAALFGPERFSFVEGSTKSGKSSFSRVWLIKETLRHLKQSAFIAPTFQQAKDQFKGTCRWLTNVEKAGLCEFNKSNLIITFSTGGSIQFFTGEVPNSIYGFQFSSIVVDEASRIRDFALWEMALSTVTMSNGKIRCIGNVYGRNNWHYRLCRLSEKGGIPNSKYHILTAQDVIDAGMQPASYLDEFKAMYTRDKFLELFFCIASEAAANPFGMTNIDRISKPSMSSGEVFCWGLDIAQTKDGGDATCLIGLNKHGDVVRFIHERIEGPEVIQLVMDTVRENEILYLDGTAIGKMVYDSLKGLAPRAIDNKKWKSYVFTQQSKELLINTLQANILDNNVSIMKDSILYKELMDFEQTEVRGRMTYGAPVGYHDDAAIAFALAVKAYADNKHLTLIQEAEVHWDEDLGLPDSIW